MIREWLSSGGDNAEGRWMSRSTLVPIIITAMLALAAPAAAAPRDRDHDGLPDRWETRHGLSSTSKGGSADPDRDRVDNLNEHREGTHPRDRDSDNDGRPDGREDRDRDMLDNSAEDRTGHDPRDRDSDDDGVIDGREQAGVVASFDGEQLVIKLAGGGTVSGLVDEDTELFCATEKDAEADWAKPVGGRAATTPSEEEEPADEGEEDEGDDSDDADAGDDEEESADEEEDEDAAAAVDDGVLVVPGGRRIVRWTKRVTKPVRNREARSPEPQLA